MSSHLVSNNFKYKKDSGVSHRHSVIVEVRQDDVLMK